MTYSGKIFAILMQDQRFSYYKINFYKWLRKNPYLLSMYEKENINVDADTDI